MPECKPAPAGVFGQMHPAGGTDHIKQRAMYIYIAFQITQKHVDWLHSYWKILVTVCSQPSCSIRANWLRCRKSWINSSQPLPQLKIGWWAYSCVSFHFKHIQQLGRKRSSVNERETFGRNPSSLQNLPATHQWNMGPCDVPSSFSLFSNGITMHTARLVLTFFRRHQKFAISVVLLHQALTDPPLSYRGGYFFVVAEPSACILSLPSGFNRVLALLFTTRIRLARRHSPL